MTFSSRLTSIDDASPKRLESAPARSAWGDWGSRALLWALFASISMGLGYATLNRYDPRGAGRGDVWFYVSMANRQYAEVESPYRWRVLTPSVV